MKLYTLLFCLLTTTIYAMDQEKKQNLREDLKTITTKTIELIINQQKENVIKKELLIEDLRSQSPSSIDDDLANEFLKHIHEQDRNFLEMLPLIKEALKDSPTKEIIGDNTFKSVASTTSIEDK
ncbi:MAG: hypothetical protein ACXWL2_04100 [Candidatus Chromulinivorax sp.]